MLTEVKNQFKISLLSIKYSILRSMINKSSFLFSVLLMFISNASFLVQWIIILSVSDGADLSMKQILFLWGIMAGAYGLSNIIFCGVHYLPEYIINGKLDAYLVQPKSVLISIATSQTSMSAFGDLLYGYAVVLIASPSVITFLYASLFIITGAIIYACFVTIMYSLLFFSINFRDLVTTLTRIPTSFGTYPENIFSGVLKVLLYTIFPIGFIVYLPVRVLLTNNILIALIVILFTIFMVVFAFVMFNMGLKRYSSTNLMNARV